MKRIDIIEDSRDDEYYGPTIYIRVANTGEHVQDDNGLLLHLCGIYPQDILDKLIKALEEE